MSQDHWQSLLPGCLKIEFAHHTLWLLPDKAIFWPEQSAVLIADVHLGKANSFRQSGVAVPTGTGQENLNRLSQLLTMTKAQHLIVLGDWFHSERGIGQELIDSIALWRAQWQNINCVLVHGNHDRNTLQLTAKLGFEIASDSFTLGGIALEHGHNENGSHPSNSELSNANPHTIVGHFHPVFVLRGKGRDSVRLPVFWKTKNRLCLPSFGEFTGGFCVEPSKGDALFGVGDGQVFKLPTG
jgi:uncharacterized protein